MDINAFSSLRKTRMTETCLAHTDIHQYPGLMALSIIQCVVVEGLITHIVRQCSLRHVPVARQHSLSQSKAVNYCHCIGAT